MGTKLTKRCSLWTFVLAQTCLRSAFPEADSEIKIICTSEFNDRLLGETSELVRKQDREREKDHRQRDFRPCLWRTASALSHSGVWTVDRATFCPDPQ